MQWMIAATRLEILIRPFGLGLVRLLCLKPTAEVIESDPCHDERTLRVCNRVGVEGIEVGAAARHGLRGHPSSSLELRLSLFIGGQFQPEMSWKFCLYGSTLVTSCDDL